MIALTHMDPRVHRPKGFLDPRVSYTQGYECYINLIKIYNNLNKTMTALTHMDPRVHRPKGFLDPRVS